MSAAASAAAAASRHRERPPEARRPQLKGLPFDLVFADMRLGLTGQGAALVADVRARLSRANVIALPDTDDREPALSGLRFGRDCGEISEVQFLEGFRGLLLAPTCSPLPWANARSPG